MEPKYSLLPFRGDTPENNPTPARSEDQSPERFSLFFWVFLFFFSLETLVYALFSLFSLFFT